MSELKSKFNMSSDKVNFMESNRRDNFENYLNTEKQSHRYSNEESYKENNGLLQKCRDSIENMHVEIEEERKLRFDLQKDFLKLENDYNNNLKDLKQTKIELNQVSEENNSLQSILGSYKAKISELSYANAQMDSDLNNLKEYEEANTNLGKHNEELTAINSEMKQRLEELDQELFEKERYYDSLAHKAEDLEKTNKNLKNINSDLDIENSDLKSRIERLEVQNKISDQLRSQLNKSKDYYDRLIDQSKSEFDSKVQELERDFEEKELDLKRKYKDIDNSNKKEMLDTITSIQRDLEESNHGYEKIKAANAELRNELRQYQNANSQLKQELDMKDGENDKNMRDLSNKYDFMMKNLSDEADNLRAKCEKLSMDLESKNLAVMKLEDNLKTVRNSAETERSQITQRANSTQSELARLKERVKELEQGLEEREYLVNNKTAELTYFKDKYDEECHSFNEKINDLEYNVSNLKKQLQDKDANMNNINQKLIMKEGELKEAKERYSSAKHRETEVIKDYESRLMELKAKSNSKLSLADQKVYQTESQLSKVKSEYSLLRSTLDKLTNESQSIKIDYDQKYSTVKQKYSNKYNLLKEYVKKEFENIRLMLNDYDRLSRNVQQTNINESHSYIDRNLHDLSSSYQKRYDEYDQDHNRHGNTGPYQIGYLNQINKVMSRMEREIDEKNL